MIILSRNEGDPAGRGITPSTRIRDEFTTLMCAVYMYVRERKIKI
jgi:hypothetical protein